MKFCPRCGNFINHKYAICPKCSFDSRNRPRKNIRNTSDNKSNYHLRPTIDIPKLELKKNQEIIYLTEGENNLLLKLVEKRNDIVLREELAERKYDETELRKVDVQITRLRQKIEANPKQPQFIKTIRSKGYKLICNEI